MLRLKVTRSLCGTIDGIQLDRFQLGCVYEMGPTLAAVLLSEGWAELAVNGEAVSNAPLAGFRFDVIKRRGAKRASGLPIAMAAERSRQS